MCKKTKISITVLVGMVLCAGSPAEAGQGYWDVFSVGLTHGGQYWDLVNGGGGPLADPIVSPDPNGAVVIDGSTPLGGIAWAFGGHDWGTGTLETEVSRQNSIQLLGANAYFLNVCLDSRTSGYTDHLYPSWGTISNITVTPWTGTSWGSAITPSWVISPLTDAGGTQVTSNSVVLGANDSGDPEGGTQHRGIFGASAQLPAAQGYQVIFDSDLNTWDSYALSGQTPPDPPAPQPLPKGGQVAPLPANVLPSPLAVPGKEYSDKPDCEADGTADPLQVIAFRGDGTASNTFDYSGSGPLESDQVDALANSQDAYFYQVVADQVPLVTSVDTGDPKAGDILYQMARKDITGTWIAAPGINAVAPPSDVDGLELWAKELNDPAPDDSLLFSLDGDPNGVAVLRYNPLTNTSASYILTADLKTALDTTEEIDLDALMAWDGNDNGEWDLGDSIIFSIEETISQGGIFDGGELWVWQFGSAAGFLVHGGEVWDTAHTVGAHFGVGTEEINALEAVPEPATLSLLALGGLVLLRRRRRP